MNPSILNPAPEVTLSHIETSARKLREARDDVSEIVTALHNQIAALQSDAIRRIKSAVSRTADRRSELFNLIDCNRHLFIKPKTATFYGICCGVEKGRGRIAYDSEESVIAAAEKKLPDLLDTIAPATRALLKTALKKLTGEQLEKLGCTVEGTGDRVIVRYTDEEVDKLVNALLKSATDEAQAEAA
jgi:hypothetical protein